MEFATSTPKNLSRAPLPPYVSYTTLRRLLETFRQAIPARIDRSVMGSMSESAQSQMVAALQALGLITRDGTPTEDLRAWVEAPDEQARKAVLERVLRRTFSFIFDVLDLRTATARQLEEAISKRGASGSTLRRCLTFFIAAAKDAGFELSPYIRKRRRRNGPTSERRRTTKLAGGGDATGREIEGGSEAELWVGGGRTWAELLLSKFPEFDPAWPEELKAKWFDAFERLMRSRSQ